MNNYKIPIVTQEEINSIEHAIEELRSLLEGAHDEHYIKASKKHLKNLKMIMHKKILIKDVKNQRSL